MQTCYACSNRPTTSEHVPPKCLFPEQKDSGADYRCNLITVPSCEEHNLDKSEDDEYLLNVLSTNLLANAIAQAQWAKLKRAVKRGPARWNSMCNDSKDVEVTDSQTGKKHAAIQMNLEDLRFTKSLELVTLGVYYHHFGNRWEGNIRVHADFVDFPCEPNKEEIDYNRMLLFNCAKELFSNVPRHGKNQDVFYYQVCEPENSFRYLIRIGFYEGCTVTAFLGKI